MRATVAAHFGEMNDQQKRLAFDALEVRVRVYRADHEPGLEVESNISLVHDDVALNIRYRTPPRRPR